MEIVFIVQDGQITNPKKVRQFFEAHESGTYLLTSKPKNIRTLSQNKYYWACMVPAVFDGLRDMGYDEIKVPEHAHEVIKGLFLTKTIGGNDQTAPIQMAGTTTELTTVEFAALIEQVQRWAAEFLNIQIQSPGEQMEAFQ